MEYRYSLSKFNNKRIFFVFVSIIILGFILRLYNLGSPSLWLDELGVKRIIMLPFSEVVKSAHLTGFPPLYYVGMHFWVKIFGTSEFSLRFPSLTFSVISIIFIFKLSKELFNERIALISAFLLSIWPYSINYAQEAKPYAMIWLLGILSFLFFLRFIRDNKIIDLFFYIFITLVSIYSMYLSFIYIAIQNIIFPFFYDKKSYKRWFLGQAAIILLFLPWIGHFFFVITKIKYLSWISKKNDYFNFLKGLYLSITGSVIGQRSLIELFLYCFLLISAITSSKNIKNNKRKILDFAQSDYFLFSAVLIYIIIFFVIEIFFKPILIDRYLGFIHIPFVIFLSKAINKYKFQVKYALLIFLSFLIFSNHLYPYYREGLKINGQNWRFLSAELDRRIGDNDLIVTTNGAISLDYCRQKDNAAIIGCQEFYKQDFDKLDYESIFFVYVKNKLKKCKIPELKGYKIEECITTSRQRIGFVHFRKL